MVQSSLWGKTNYLAPYPCIANKYITEYDISKANINILLYYGVIDRQLYDMLYNMDKKHREIYVGKMELRDSKITEIKAKGIKEFRHKFFEANNLQDKDILAIKNDAIFVIGNECMNTQFDNIVFNKSNVYTGYMKIGGLEAYYGYDPFTNNEVLDIKGIKEHKLELHREYMVFHLCEVFYKLQTSSVEDAVKLNSELLGYYLNRSLGKGYYREFNAESKFRFNTGFSSFTVDCISDEDVKYVDLSTNVNVFRNISGCLSTLYLSHK